jgi:hypothetical protein
LTPTPEKYMREHDLCAWCLAHENGERRSSCCDIAVPPDIKQCCCKMDREEFLEAENEYDRQLQEEECSATE